MMNPPPLPQQQDEDEEEEEERERNPKKKLKTSISPSTSITNYLTTSPHLNRELERLSTAGIYCLNAQDFSLSTPAGLEVRKHFAPNFRVVLDHMSSTPMTWEEACVFIAGFFQENPEARYVLRNVSSDVDFRKGVATVWFELSMEGLRSGVMESGLGTCVWRKGGEGEGWIWGKYWNMRGMAGNQGFV